MSNDIDMTRLRRRVVIETRLVKFGWRSMIAEWAVQLLLPYSGFSYWRSARISLDVNVLIYCLIIASISLVFGTEMVGSAEKLAVNGTAEDFWLLAARCPVTNRGNGYGEVIFRNLVRMLREGEQSWSILSRSQTLSLCRWLYAWPGVGINDLWNEIIAVLSKYGSPDAILQLRLYLYFPVVRDRTKRRRIAVEGAIRAILERGRDNNKPVP
jgi:hypothetical protein